MLNESFELTSWWHHDCVPLEYGDELGIVPEPENEYDPDAIALYKGDEDGDMFTCNSKGEPSDSPAYVLDVLDLHPEVKDAWNRAKEDYWKFLDYEANGFGCFTDYIKE